MVYEYLLSSRVDYHNWSTITHTTERQMNEITREEFMTSRNSWDPTKLDDPERTSDLMISQFPPFPPDIIDSFYNDQGVIDETIMDLVNTQTTYKKNMNQKEKIIVSECSWEYNM